MKCKTSKTQLAILSFIAGAVYLFIITADFIGGFYSGVMAFKEGMKQAEIENKTGKSDSWKTCTLTLEPMDFNKFYSDSIHNLKTGELVPISYNTIHARYDFNEPRDTKIMLFDTVMTLSAMSAFVFYVLVFILFYRLVSAFYKDNIFSNDNVRRLKLIGIFTLVLYALKALFYFLYYVYIKSIFEIADYKITMSEYFEHKSLLLGIVLLIAANVMKRAITMKEEQDLTI